VQPVPVLEPEQGRVLAPAQGQEQGLAPEQVQELEPEQVPEQEPEQVLEQHKHQSTRSLRQARQPVLISVFYAFYHPPRFFKHGHRKIFLY
jgi:hypothetical protein